MPLSHTIQSPFRKAEATCPALQRLQTALRVVRRFLRSCYVDGTRALIAGRYDRRQAVIIMASSLPAILGLLSITVPGILFPTPGHQAFYHFATTLASDTTSLIPVFIGAITSTLGLKIPLG